MTVIFKTSWVVIAFFLISCTESPNSGNPFDDDASDETQVRGSVSGTVQDQDSTGLSGVNLSLLNDSIVTGGFSTVSGANGSFRIPDVLSGTYTMTFTMADYADTSFSISFNIGEDKTLAQPVKMRFAPSQARDINGNILGDVSGIDSVIAVLTGDGIDSLSPLRHKLSWLPISKRFTGAVYTPQDGLVWNVEVKVYKLGRITGYASVPFDAGAANVAVSDFDADNACPQIDSIITNDPLNNSYMRINKEGSVMIYARDDFGGSIAKYEWKFGAGTWFETSGHETVSTAPSAAQFPYACSVQVTDDEGNVSVASVSLSVLGEMTDYDGNVYLTKIIGTQEWTIENLRTTHFNDGTPIQHTTGNNWDNLGGGETDTGGNSSTAVPAYCFYNDETDSVKQKKWGALYNGAIVNNGKLVSPAEWRVPSDADWVVLANFLGGAVLASGKMKETGTVNWDPPNIDATNESGFFALPNGRVYSGIFNGRGDMAWFWSSTSGSAGGDYYFRRLRSSTGVMEGGLNEGFSMQAECGISVRLVRGGS